jgi:hypothetical protein
MVRFDAYSATTTAAKHTDLLEILLSDDPTRFTLKQGKGFHTFGERISVTDDEAKVEVGSISWGGRQGDRAMIEVKGEGTPQAVERLRSDFPHRCTRVDSCADFDAPGAFERLLGLCAGVKKDYDLRGSKAGDWDDHPEDGRTFYMGATSSVTRLRLYEKGLQPEYRHLALPDWTRIEVQVRPEKDAKSTYSRLGPLEVWGASAWSREIASLVLQEHADPHPAGKVYRQSSFERRWQWMCLHYGATLVEALQEFGSWECVGLNVKDELQRIKRDRH